MNDQSGSLIGLCFLVVGFCAVAVTGSAQSNGIAAQTDMDMIKLEMDVMAAEQGKDLVPRKIYRDCETGAGRIEPVTRLNDLPDSLVDQEFARPSDKDTFYAGSVYYDCD